MSRYVEWNGKLWPRSFFEPPLDPPPGTCPYCGGLGLTHESWDEERFDVVVKCQHCHKWCAACKTWVKREGHTCQP